jgi:hypothetical protein
MAVISDPAFATDADVSGTISVGSMRGSVDGTAKWRRDASATTTHLQVSGFDQVSDTIRIGDQAWARKSPGPWLVSPVEAGGLRPQLDAVIDVGVESHAGRSLHHLQPRGGSALSAADLGFETEGAKDPRFTLDAYATDDGAPAVLEITGAWQQVTTGGSLPVDLAITYTLRPPVATIEPPEDVWQTHVSKGFDYSMAMPAGWKVASSKTKDAYGFQGADYIYVAPQALQKGTKLAGFVKALKDAYEKQFGADPATDEPTTLGGLSAQRLTYRLTGDSGQEVTVSDYAAVHGGKGWEVFLVTSGGSEDVALFETFVVTFAFTD